MILSALMRPSAALKTTRVLLFALRARAIGQCLRHFPTVITPAPRACAASDDLFDIARSTALFLRRRHGATSIDLVEIMYPRDRGRLLRHLVAGTCEPRDISRLLAALVAERQAGLSEELTLLEAKLRRRRAFCPSTPNPLGIMCSPRVSLV